jgi:hypothetical protein|tara:strand:- start:1704 stop:1952 length:249 start_codon:yes stop_codon:yes gene_type:complete
MPLQKGDLIALQDGTKAILTSNTYTHRKLDHHDNEMIAHGMGHLAGTYCTAFNILIPETGKTRRVICGDTTFEKMADVEVTA